MRLEKASSEKPNFFLFGCYCLSVELSLIEEANYQYGSLEKVINSRFQELEQRIREVEAMSQQEFLAWISKSIFGVAMKEYYIDRWKRQIKSLKTMKEHIDGLLEYWRSNKAYLDMTLKQKCYQGYVRQLRQAIERLGESKFNSKLPSFS